MIKEPDHINAAPKIKEILSIHKLVRIQNQKDEYNISFFKGANEEEPFHVQWYGDNNQLIFGQTARPVKYCFKYLLAIFDDHLSPKQTFSSFKLKFSD